MQALYLNGKAEIVKSFRKASLCHTNNITIFFIKNENSSIRIFLYRGARECRRSNRK